MNDDIIDYDVRMILALMNNESMPRKNIDDGLLMRIADHYIFVRECEKEIECLRKQAQIIYDNMREKQFIPISLTEQKGDLMVEETKLIDIDEDIPLKILKDNYDRLPENIKYFLNILTWL